MHTQKNDHKLRSRREESYLFDNTLTPAAAGRREKEKKKRAAKRKRTHLAACGLFALILLAVFAVRAALNGKAGDGIAAHTFLENESALPQNGEQAPAGENGTEADDPRLLMLVNADHPIAEGYAIDPVELRHGMAVDRLCYPDLQDMMDDCRKAGLKPLICSAYRTVEKQRELYDAKVTELMRGGLSLADAEEKARKVVAYPGTSEHHTGLALDIVDETYQMLDSAQEKTAVQRWLLAHSWEYGFILRYPAEKTEETGIIYEPWHYRYVGKTLAKAITESGLSLEEYCGSMAG